MDNKLLYIIGYILAILVDVQGMKSNDDAQVIRGTDDFYSPEYYFEASCRIKSLASLLIPTELESEIQKFMDEDVDEVIMKQSIEEENKIPDFLNQENWFGFLNHDGYPKNEKISELETDYVKLFPKKDKAAIIALKTYFDVCDDDEDRLMVFELLYNHFKEFISCDGCKIKDMDMKLKESLCKKCFRNFTLEDNKTV